MPRRPRLHTPGTLHHVIVRGIERRRIVKNVADCKNVDAFSFQKCVKLPEPNDQRLRGRREKSAERH
jgi:hypothetical protein